MDKRLLKPKTRLIWFLNFINKQVESLSGGEMFNLWLEIRDVAYGSLGPYAIRDEDLVKWGDRRERARSTQEALRKCLRDILSVAKKNKKAMIRPVFKVPEVSDEGDDEATGRCGLALESIILSKAHDKPVEGWSMEYIAGTYPLDMIILADGDKVFHSFPKLEDRLLLEFVSLLSKFPLSLIHQCQREDCKGYFLKATKKEKRYCSNRCAWVMASRIRRKTQVEKEREKKKQSYAKKIKKKYGQNVKIRSKARKMK
jgi:hypothetical protein